MQSDRPCAYTLKRVGHQLGAKRCPACVRDDGISQAFLTRIEKGECLPPLNTRNVFADSLRPSSEANPLLRRGGVGLGIGGFTGQSGPQRRSR